MGKQLLDSRYEASLEVFPRSGSSGAKMSQSGTSSRIVFGHWVLVGIVAGLLCGCGGEHVPSDDETRATQAIRDFGGRITMDGTKAREVFLNGTRITDGDLYHLRALPHLELLNLQSTGITDAGMEQVGRLKTLKRLTIQRSKVTDAGLVHLKGLTSLIELDMVGLPITDAGLEHLHSMISLEKLYFDRNRTTPDGVNKLQDSLPKTKIFAD
jgi:hypothetical protein